jgi:hypothetical protein
MAAMASALPRAKLKGLVPGSNPSSEGGRKSYPGEGGWGDELSVLASEVACPISSDGFLVSCQREILFV